MTISRNWPKGFRTAVIATGALLSAAATAQAIELKVVPGGDQSVTTISMSGGVEPGDSLKVRGFLSGLDQSRQIVAELTINGGNYLEGRLIGKFVYDARIKTVAPGNNVYCGGPCLLILVAGRDKATGQPSFVKYSTGRLGITSQSLRFEEREYTAKEFSDSVTGQQNLFRETSKYLMAVHARPVVLSRFFALPPGSPGRLLSNEEALDIGIPVYEEKSKQVIQPLPLTR